MSAARPGANMTDAVIVVVLALAGVLFLVAVGAWSWRRA